MELIELLRQVVEKLAPFVERDGWGQRLHDPDRMIERLVEAAGQVLDDGLLIVRGF